MVLQFLSLVCLAASAAASTPALIGESEKVYPLAQGNTEVRGLAFDEVSPEAPRLFVLDRSGHVFIYTDELKFLDRLDLPAAAGPRGLAFALEDDGAVLYFLSWAASKGGITSQLWRWCIDDNTTSVHDLSLYPIRIGDREVFDVTIEKGTIKICFDATGYKDRHLRVSRGIVELAHDGKLTFVKHLPDSGEAPSHGLAAMELNGAHYLWATHGSDQIYVAEAATGRGLFYFDRPGGGTSAGSGLCFGRGALWVPEKTRIHRVNVTRNLDARREGPRIFRRLIMTIDTRPAEDADDPGTVYHYYSRPYAYEQLGNQGVWPETESVVDLSDAPNAVIKEFFHDPGNDASSRQQMRLVEYANAPAREYSSRYEIDVWTNRCRTYVYPHRASRKADALKGTDYLADDPELFNLRDTKTYNDFFDRVKAHVEAKYGTAAEMDNPYWAARNALEYIQDHYYYPSRPKMKPATVDYDRGHYDANPGNLKIALSGRPYDKSQIIACSGTSVMMAGAMRHLGIPARWLGTGTEQGPAAWDGNKNGLLDKDEAATCTNGHRYTQVWLGEHYGWTCFDATPTKPDFNDYDPPPPLQSQWRYMSRAAAGHRRDRRIVFNVGSGLFRPLYRDFVYDEDLAVENNCGGDQRYNLQGRFEKPELWKPARQRIMLKNVCFITGVTVTGPKKETKVTWNLEGDWHKDPGARLSIYLQRVKPEPGNLARVAEALPCSAREAEVDLSAYHGKDLRLVLRKDGDAETGGQSDTFDLD
jgi:hypothetical protein